MMLLPACLLLVFLFPPNLFAQSPELPRIATLELESTYPEGFAYLSGIRELSDGRILVADPTGEVLVRADLDEAVGDTLGRVGEGPQEYRQPDRVFPLPGDSTLLVDLGNGRLIVIDPGGEFVRWPSTARANAEGRARTLQPGAVDGTGRVYAFSMDAIPPGDSVYIGRFPLEGPEEGVAARLWRPDSQTLRSRGRRALLYPFDGYAVGEDGRVAVVRANGYSVDWFLPDGRIVRGPPHEAERYPVGEAERQAEVELMMAEAVFTVAESSGGQIRNRSMRRGVPPSRQPEMNAFTWPNELPVFRASGIWVSSDFEVWVERMVPVGSPPIMEIFDGEGLRLGYAELPVGGRLLGFGDGGGDGVVAYLARTDASGLKWLERYRVLYGEG